MHRNAYMCTHAPATRTCVPICHKETCWYVIHTHILSLALPRSLSLSFCHGLRCCHLQDTAISFGEELLNSDDEGSSKGKDTVLCVHVWFQSHTAYQCTPPPICTALDWHNAMQHTAAHHNSLQHTATYTCTASWHTQHSNSFTICSKKY